MSRSLFIKAIILIILGAYFIYIDTEIVTTFGIIGIILLISGILCFFFPQKLDKFTSSTQIESFGSDTGTNTLKRLSFLIISIVIIAILLVFGLNSL